MFLEKLREQIYLSVITYFKKMGN